MSEWHCTVDGKQYGPVDDDVVRSWIAQGRVKSTDMLWKDGMVEWLRADSVPEMRAAFASAPAGAPGGGPPTIPQSSYAMGAAAGGRYLRPHRGGAILALGILSWVICCICGIIAWSMGNNDLREMEAGRMDPSGRGLVQAGRIVGMISVILSIVVGGIYLIAILMFGIGAGSGSFH